MNDYHFRLNTRAGTDQFQWRIWENGRELSHCATSIEINVPAETTTTQEADPDLFGSYHRYNIGCKGHGQWRDSVFQVNPA
jgi:hypothetical protein